MDDTTDLDAAECNGRECTWVNTWTDSGDRGRAREDHDRAHHPDQQREEADLACHITGSPPRCTTHDVLATDWSTADDGPTASAAEPTCPLAGEPAPVPPEWRCGDCGTTGTLTDAVTHPDHCEGVQADGPSW